MEYRMARLEERCLCWPVRVMIGERLIAAV
jgi:hypothetical protein